MTGQQGEGGTDRPYDTDVERELVARAKTELPYRTDAYSLLMKSYEKRVYWMCRRIICEDSESQDAAQEVFIRVFHHLPSFKEDSSFKTWLYSIARNVALTQLKKSKPLKEASEITDFHESGLEQVYDPHESTEKALDLDRAFSKLKVAERQILSLRFVADMDIKEIAEFLDIKLSTAKMRLYRATEELKRFV